jgi:very-short-patch-repair endonuclease
LRSGWLHLLHRGVYAVGHPVSIRGRFAAAVLACGDGAALSHLPASDVWAIRRWSGKIVVTVPRGRVGPAGVEIHRSRMLEPEDLARRDGIRVTSVARTLLDLAGVLGPLDLARAIDRAERAELFDLAAVDGVLARARGRRGAAALRRAVAAWRPRQTRSELEDRYFELLQEAGLPLPRFNVLLEGELATHEVDSFWPAHGLVVQLDGFAYHRTRVDRERDAGTDADLELAGYRVVRLTWDDVTVHRQRTTRRHWLLLSGKPPIGHLITGGSAP